MVLSDPFREIEASVSRSHRAPLVMDRVAAFAIDWFCFSFLAFTILAPLKRNILVARLMDHEDEFIFGYSLSLLALFCLAVLYQSVFLIWKGATPGKLILKLRVKNVWNDEPLTATTAFVRSFAWCLSCVMAFIPHLGVFTNERRRPLYDRIADTEVISLNGRYADQPTRFALQMTKVIGLFLLIFASYFLVHDAYSYMRVSRFIGDGDMDKWREELVGVSPDSCAEVENAFEEWNQSQSLTRLGVALALYSGNSLDSDCLTTEAFRSFQSGEEVELAYLAKSFVHSDDADLSDEYLQKVCVEGPKTEACRFSKMIEMWADQDITKASTEFENLLKDGSIYVKVWAVKHFERIKDFAEEERVLNQLWQVKGLASFVNTHRGVAYWGLHRRDEARVAINSALSDMIGIQKLEVSSWFCYRELVDSCKSLNTPPCLSFMNSVEELPEKFPNAGHLLTYLRAQECKGGEVNFDEVASLSPSEQGFVFVKAIEALKEDKKDVALKVLKPILFDENWDRAFKDEALRRLVQVLSLKSDFNEIVEIWSQGDKTSWEWRMQGLSLLREFLKRDDLEGAVSVGTSLAKEDGLPERDRKALVLFVYHNGDHKFAFNLVRRSGRTPASAEPNQDEEYEKISYALIREFVK